MADKKSILDVNGDGKVDLGDLDAASKMTGIKRPAARSATGSNGMAMKPPRPSGVICQMSPPISKRRDPSVKSSKNTASPSSCLPTRLSRQHDHLVTKHRVRSSPMSRG